MLQDRSALKPSSATSLIGALVPPYIPGADRYRVKNFKTGSVPGGVKRRTGSCAVHHPGKFGDLRLPQHWRSRLEIEHHLVPAIYRHSWSRYVWYIPNPATHGAFLPVFPTNRHMQLAAPQAIMAASCQVPRRLKDTQAATGTNINEKTASGGARLPTNRPCTI